jgi:hypothetical protein
MDMVLSHSLYQKVMESTRTLFTGGQMRDGEKADLASWILTHQNRRNGFLFHPGPEDEQAGLLLVSGEKPRTHLLANNALELETLRLLVLLQAGEPGIGLVFEAADRRLSKLCFASVCTTGECAGASIAYLRYRTARGGAEALIRRGLESLRRERDGAGRWHKFPFYYTLLWLLDLPAGLAADELEYAAPACRRLAARLDPADPFTGFRRSILGRVLERPPQRN